MTNELKSEIVDPMDRDFRMAMYRDLLDAGEIEGLEIFAAEAVMLREIQKLRKEGTTEALPNFDPSSNLH